MQGSLLRWYARHRRDLPWRRDKDPYHILVSEFMLQQTRVETVLPYFERFLKRFPTLPALARAPLHNVLKAWAGLGYYARARHLHSAAKIIRDDHGGKVPSTKKSLLSLPGFGPYTAGAVASLAFSQPVAALDGNVNRLLARLLNLRERTSTGSLKRTLERSVEDLIPPNRASDFNQALMDLGALICVPGRPRCPLCPIKRFCPSRGVQDQESQRKRRKLRKEVWAVALVERGGRFFLYRKEEPGLLSGLWQFPAVVVKRDSNQKEKGNTRRILQEKEALKRELKENFGLRIKVKGSFFPQEHLFTHLQVTMKPFLCSLGEILPWAPVKEVRWVKFSNLSRYPISTAMRKVASLIPSGLRGNGNRAPQS